MEKDGACEAEGFVKANGAYEEGKGLGEGNGVDGYFEGHGNGEGDEEGEDGGGDDGEGEEEGGAKGTGAGEEEEEGGVHQDIPEQDEQYVERVSIPGKRRKPGEQTLQRRDQPARRLKVCARAESQHAMETKTLALHPVAHRSKRIRQLVKGDNLDVDVFAGGHREPLAQSMDDIRRPRVGDLVRQLDRIQDVEVRECADNTEEHDGLNRRIGCMERKGAEHRSQHRTTRTIQNNNTPTFLFYRLIRSGHTTTINTEQ